MTSSLKKADSGKALDRRGDAMGAGGNLQRKFREVEQREIEIDELLQEHRKELNVCRN